MVNISLNWTKVDSVSKSVRILSSIGMIIFQIKIIIHDDFYVKKMLLSIILKMFLLN